NTTEITFTVANNTTTPTTPTNALPSVTLTAPTVTTVTGTMTFAANASDTDGTINRVEFYLVNSATPTQRTLIASDTTNSYGGTYNTAQLPNGTYELMAVAFDNAGGQATSQRTVTLSNTTSGGTDNTGGGTDTGGSTGSGATTLPANGARAIATFESLGMYWSPASDPGATGCSMRYRKHSESAWRQALNMWYDARNRECRGSIVHLTPGSDYAVEMGIGTNFTTGVNTRTWAESFPIARTVNVPSGTTLNITEGGSAQGYVVYDGGGAVLDAANGADNNVAINASYVIVRNFTMRGARIDGIRISPAVTNVVIEDNDISGWGRPSGQTVNGVQTGVDRDSGIRANCVNTPGSLQRVVIQRNRIHDPRYGANSWDNRIHPLGAVGIEISHCGGNNVIRYNEITSPSGRYYKDGMGGQANFSTLGFSSGDNDIYGNIVSHAWDDGIEVEGGGRNTRVWGNYIDQTAAGIANTPVSTGPMYVFRNVYNRSRRFAFVSLDNDDRLQFNKAGSQTEYGHGRRYVFHNTLLQATQSGVVNGLGAGDGVTGLSNAPMTNTVTRNNILHVWRSGSTSIGTNGGTGNDLDYDLRNGGISAYAGAEANGIVGVPVYRQGHGWGNWAGGNYQLDPSSPGYDRGVRIPNFNDAFTGAGPDMGAHEGDTPAMRLGRGSGGSTTTATSGDSTSSGGTTTTASTDGGVCSTILCAAQ
ncbi:MAG TPA: Ig-like domain-containing protein, partial [Vicinamibacterales bacterium]|nr:Ig-like domain-containing protein [Vicinamibacterales bacterium]